MKKNKRRSPKRGKQFPSSRENEDKLSPVEPLLREGQYEELEQIENEKNIEGRKFRTKEKSDYYSDTKPVPPKGSDRNEGRTRPQQTPSKEPLDYFEEGNGSAEHEDEEEQVRNLSRKQKRRKAA